MKNERSSVNLAELFDLSFINVIKIFCILVYLRVYIIIYVLYNTLRYRNKYNMNHFIELKISLFY